ncbi:N-acetyldiaminopimelate deacetylase [Pullulanibacillus pueri]|uniref:N-acetyldiaminopimelate deacetylase n=1 Tax=Pullulanibacillus pueri TaxID=1437324 RepID=A0A8J2ZR27_9BACL|nr:N-acetyldiaminopimelate deacetylase [Pullulanibacillus pueri]MBM7680053.1 N-acetyldiaminopimelate deacetylase [Pullulanibacillus pueri]GGH74129.1 N-acetyldiaminopimelate deacetylase [Pullulanibacillus pueri]
MGLDLIQTRRSFHRIPELGFQEHKTQALILNTLESFSAGERLSIKTWKTGVLVFIRGTQPENHKTKAYRTDIDGLPIQEETGYDFCSEHEGNMHACGHDFHMTIALGVIERLIADPPEHNVLVIFQPAEEGPGGALPMLKSSEFNEWRPDEIMALHVAPEYPTGTIATREGLLFANTSELFIDLKGKGGHAAYPHLSNDMVVAASHFVTQIQSIVSRRIDPLDSAVVTIGKVTGGTKQNIIAETARIEGTLRALDPKTMDQIKRSIKAHLVGIEASFECDAEIDFGSNYYQVYNHSQPTSDFIDYCRSSNYPLVICKEAMTGEDFGYFLKDIPGFMFWLGVDSEAGLHAAKFKPDENALHMGVEIVTGYLKKAF